MSSKSAKANAPIIIKKYANRRLYNTATSSYVTLEDLCQLVKEESDFLVRDAKTGEDITRQESNGSQMLPVNFLRSVIRHYGEEMQKVLPTYLDSMMEHFMQNQEKFSSLMRQSMGGYSPFGQLEEIGKQNMALFQQAFAAFNPFEVTKKK
jgi:polyhydroxyalkanoate synthesis repressor PhaR